eukprot:g8861.t1
MRPSIENPPQVDSLSEGGGPMVTVAKLAKVLKFIRIVRLMKMLRAKKLKDSTRALSTPRPSAGGSPMSSPSYNTLRFHHVPPGSTVQVDGSVIDFRHLQDIWEQVERRIGSVAIVQGMMLIRVLLVVRGICHWNACLFWIIGCEDSIVTDFLPTALKKEFDSMPHWTTIPRTGGWRFLTTKGLEEPWAWWNKPMFEQYIFCFYWTLGVMRTMPAEVTPVNLVERIFVLCFMFFALSAFAVSVASLTQAYFKISERGRSFNDEMFAIRMHLHKLKVEEHSQRKIKEYLHHKFTRRRIMAKEANLLKELPPVLQHEIDFAKNLQHLQHLSCMNHLSQSIKKQICLGVTSMDMLAGQIIATSGNDARRANEFPERRPKCTCGGAWDGVRSVQVKDAEGSRSLVATEGEPLIFDEKCLLGQAAVESLQTVTTTSTCELLKIEKSKFHEVADQEMKPQDAEDRSAQGPQGIEVQAPTDREHTPHAAAGATAAISAG